jgi:CHAT domain-containing protein/Tfp pilus assembly protein PilF
MVEEIEERKIRQYLLGELSEAEMTTLEERLMTDDDLFEMRLVIEDELIDARAGNELSAEEQTRFDAYFLATPERRERLELARALHQYAARHADEITRAENPASGGTSEATTTATRADDPGDTVVKKFAPRTWDIRPSPRLSPSQYVILAAAAVILIAVGLDVWRVFFYQPEISKGLQALNQAYREQRPTEARISGFDYAPPPPVTRGSQQENFDYVARDRAEALIHESLAEHSDARFYHDLGRLYLAKREFDKAIEQFDKALKLDQKDPYIESDYGAALLEMGKADRARGDLGKSLEKFAKSLEHLNKAIELKGSLREAVFNRALCHQYMFLPNQAEEDWRSYLEKDPTSRWADEARQHLRLLEDQIQKTSQTKDQVLRDFFNAYESRDDERAWKTVSQNMEASTGKLIWWQLLDSFFAATASQRDDHADSNLNALTYVGELESKKTRDAYVSDIAFFYRSASPQELVILAEAHALVNRGLMFCLQARFAKAMDFFRKAREMLDKAGNKMEAEFADLYVGHCYLHTGNTEQASLIFRRLIQTCERESYRWLGGLALSGLSNVEFDDNNYSNAIAYTNQALKISEQMGDTFNTQRNLTQLADDHKIVGDFDQSIIYLQHCLDMAETCWPGPKQMWFNYDALAEVLTYLQLYVAAVAYEKEALRLAVEELQDPSPIYQSHVRIGIILGKLQDYDEAIRHLQIGYDIAKGHSPDGDGQLFIAYSSLQLGHLYRQTEDFNKAISYYDQALAILDRLGFQAVSYDVHKGRLLCHIAQGDDAQTQEELKTVLRLSENYRTKILEEKNRNKFFDIEQSVYDLAIDFQYSRMHNNREAFEYSEASRARSLLDLITSQTQIADQNGERDITFTAKVFQPLKLAAIQERLPDQAQILQYAVLKDKLLIWAISKKNFAVGEQPISQNELNEKVLALRKLIAAPPSNKREEQIQKASWLYNILIKPVEGSLDKQKPLCIIPDKILNYLPFNALISPAGDYLVSDYLLSFSPSASVFILCCEAAHKKERIEDERLLSVGNPLFDHEAFPSLDELPSSAEEAREITTYYKSSRLLVGPDARAEEVLNELVKCDVAHFASHYLANESSPMLSKLLLAKEPERSDKRVQPDGVLQADEIYQKRLARLRLVVLSACETGIEHYYNGEGMIGMSRPFMVASVPLVLASLWPVDSDSTAALMIKFHFYRKREGRSTSEALRRAQLDMIADSQRGYNDPNRWAAFIVIGGYAKF